MSYLEQLSHIEREFQVHDKALGEVYCIKCKCRVKGMTSGLQKDISVHVVQSKRAFSGR